MRRIAALLAVALLGASCGEGKKPSPPGVGTPPAHGGMVSPPPPPPHGTVGIQISGSERIAWTQFAESAADLRAHAYRIYVDSVGSPLAGAQCVESAGADGYPCTAPLPSLAMGPHVIELSAIRAGIESPRSAPLNVMRVASVETAQTQLASDGTASARGRAGVDRVIAMAGPVSAMSTTPDGRVLAIEDARRVRIIENDRLVDEPALALDPRRATILGLAVDSAFATTQIVYVAWTDRTVPGTSELHITRYREFRNSLRDGATIVSGLPLPAEGPVPLAVDGEGLLYVAMPGRRNGEVDRNGALYSASILRFTRDGFVPSTNLRASPVIAVGYAEPSGLAVDMTHRRLWLSGRHGSWPHAVASLPIDISATQRWPGEPVGSSASQHGSVAVLRGDVSALEWLILATKNGVRRAEIGEHGRVSQFDEIARLTLTEPVLAHTARPVEAVYVAGLDDQQKAVIVRLAVKGSWMSR